MAPFVIAFSEYRLVYSLIRRSVCPRQGFREHVAPGHVSGGHFDRRRVYLETLRFGEAAARIEAAAFGDRIRRGYLAGQGRLLSLLLPHLGVRFEERPGVGVAWVGEHGFEPVCQAP